MYINILLKGILKFEMNTCTLQYKFDDVTVQNVNMPLKLIRNTKLINRPA